MLRAMGLAAVMAATLVFAGCSDEPPTTGGSGSGGSAGQGGQGGGSGGMGGTGGSGGSGGMGVVTNYGPPGQDLVTAGNVSKSPGFRLEWTLGQSTTNQSKTSSPKYRLQGGLIGANGSLP